MIQRTSTKRPTAKPEILSVYTEISVHDRTIPVYGTPERPLFPATKITEWIDASPDTDYQDWLELVEDTDREIIRIRNEKGRQRAIWAITETGMDTILDKCTEDSTPYRTAMHDAFHPEESQPTYTVQEMLNNPSVLIQVLTRLQQEQEKNKQLTETVYMQEQTISDMQPKVEYCNKVLSCENVFSTSVIAQDYGKSAVWLNTKLHMLGVQYKRNGVWILYSKYADKGYTKTKTHEVTDEFGVSRATIHTYWTQAGRKLIYDILKEQGIEPVAESEQTEPESSKA